MNFKTLGTLLAVLCGSSLALPLPSHAFPGWTPPVWTGSGAPIWSGSGGPVITGSGYPCPLPPIWSGSAGTGIVGHCPLSPIWSGSGAPIITGSGNPPPDWWGGTGGLPTGSFESLTIRVAFTAASGTSMRANGVLHATSVSGTDNGTLGVHTWGLAAGTYTVSAVLDSGTGSVTLGTFDVNAPWTSGTATPPPAWHGPSTHTQFGGPRGIAFPAGVDPFDIASLAISDSNANVLFTADLTTITDGAFDARTPIVSGTTVTAAGVAQIHAFAKAGVVNGALIVHASGLPASTTYKYYVDGTEIGPVTTGTSGCLKVVATENPSGGTLLAGIDLFTVTGVTVEDDSGDVILSASF